jgi:phage terminase large subunit-like protein
VATSATKPSTPRLSEAARHLVIPSGIATTGWPPVEAQLADMGIRFDPWQVGVSRLALGKRDDGIYAATVGGVKLSIPRQVGKTFMVGALIMALCILFPGLKVVWTAHRTRTATNTFRALQGLARRRRVAPHVDHVRTANGEQEIGFTNGSVIMFGAREQGFGRGFDEIDVEVFDEDQILTEKALEDMIAATNQTRHPHGALLFFMGTPPRPNDPGETATLKRQRALSGKSDDMVYVEFSADADADPDDREQWAKANPSYPQRTPLESMLRLRENLPSDEAWMREALGVWDAPGASSVIPAELWNAAGDEHSVATDRFALGVEAAPDLAGAAVVLAGRRPDGAWHIELDERRDGTAWVVPYVKALVEANPQLRTVVADAGSPTAALLEDFDRAGLRVKQPKVNELGRACARLLEGIVTGSVRHTRQPQLAVAVSVAGKRDLGDSGMWVWSRRNSASDITPVQAATLALWGAQAEKVKRPAKRQSGRKVAVVS